jgi:hypothetical protein
MNMDKCVKSKHGNLVLYHMGLQRHENIQSRTWGCRGMPNICAKAKHTPVYVSAFTAYKLTHISETIARTTSLLIFRKTRSEIGKNKNLKGLKIKRSGARGIRTPDLRYTLANT